LTYRYVGGIGEQAHNVLMIDTTDIATNTNEVGYSLTQRFYLRPTTPRPCKPEEVLASGHCLTSPASGPVWQLAQKFFLDPYFGGAVVPANATSSIPPRLTPVAFLTGRRNMSPVISRVRFEAIAPMRLEWDVDFDRKPAAWMLITFLPAIAWATTVGVGHAMLNAVDEKASNSPSGTLQASNFSLLLPSASKRQRPYFAATAVTTSFGTPFNMPGFRLSITGLLRLDRRLPALPVGHRGYHQPQ